MMDKCDAHDFKKRAPTPEEEREAIAWLEREARGEAFFHAQRARTLLVLLAMPRMPEEPDKEALTKMRHQWANAKGCSWDIVREIYRALYAHLAKGHGRLTLEEEVRRYGT